MKQHAQEMIDLYKQASKHSGYQLLHPTLKQLITHEIPVQSRQEQERLAYLLKNIDFQGKSVTDIGGNTGFFTFAALEHGAASVNYYEGNPAHAKFVKLACNALNLQDKITVHPGYIDLSGDSLGNSADILFLLNVLHHIGDDYGESGNGIGNVLMHVREVVQRMSCQAKFMIFQLGFNWKGDRNLPLFPNGTKSEMAEFIRNICTDYWTIEKIGVAHKNNGIIHYSDMSSSNNYRDDTLGEFLNRPLFILKSSQL